MATRGRINDLFVENGQIAEVSGLGNAQDIATWEREAATIAASERKIEWHQPSRHEGTDAPAKTVDEVFAGIDAFADQMPAAEAQSSIQGGRERGLVLHKLMEEVLSGETPDDESALKSRAGVLLAQLGLEDHADASAGPSSAEMASTVKRTLQLPEIAELRPRLQPEFWVYAGTEADKTVSLTGGIADAIAFDGSGRMEVIVDWKSDVDPTPAVVEQYRAQVRDYIAATGAALGLIVFMTSGRIERVQNG